MAKYYFTHDNGGYVLENEETAFRHVGACSNLSVRMRDASESVEITDISWRKWAPILYETSADDIYVTDTSSGYDQEVLSYSQLCAYLHSIIVSSGGSGANAVWGQITGTLSQQTDLKNALDAKQGTLEAGTGITIEGNVISATGGGGSTTWGSITGTLSSQTDLKNALDAKQDSLTFDNSPTSGSNNPVKSGGVYTALSGKQNTLTFDNSPTENSDNPVKSGGIYTALSGKANSSHTHEQSDVNGLSTALSGKQDTLTAGDNISIVGNVISATLVQSDWNQTNTSAVDYIKNKPTLRQPATDGTAGQYLKSAGSGNAPTWETLDTTPTESSAKAITSGAVYTALEGKQATLTFDNSPTENSNNPVKSGGVFTALAGKADASTVRFVIHAEYNVGTGAVTLASTTTQAELMSALTAKKAMDIDFTVSGTYFRSPMLSFYEDGTGGHIVKFRNEGIGFDVVLTADTTGNTYSFDTEAINWVGTQAQYEAITTKDPNRIYYITASNS